MVEPAARTTECSKFTAIASKAQVAGSPRPLIINHCCRWLLKLTGLRAEFLKHSSKLGICRENKVPHHFLATIVRAKLYATLTQNLVEKNFDQATYWPVKVNFFGHETCA